MYEDSNWTPMTVDPAGFLEQLSPIDGKYALSPETTAVHWRYLPFYEDGALVRVSDPGWTPGNLTIWYLLLGHKLYRLDGSSPPIHDFNRQVIDLSEDNVLDYLRFFGYFVRSEGGMFLIAESIDDPAMPASMNGAVREVIEDNIRPARYKGRDENGSYLCDAVVFHADHLYDASFTIAPDGRVELTSDKPLAGRFGVQPDAPIA